MSDKIDNNNVEETITYNELSEPIKKEFRKYVNDLTKKSRKLFNKHAFHIGYNNEIVDCLIAFLEKHPIIFAANYDITERDMIKWALSENIKQNQRMIDKIKEVETNFDLPLEYKD